MGCHQCRGEFSEEHAVMEAEGALRFQYKDIRSINSVIRSNATSNRINTIQLGKIAEQLNLRLKNSGPHTKIDLMLKKLRQPSQDYLLEDWLLIGTLLGSGSAQAKAEQLFQIFAEGRLPIADIKSKVLQRIIFISLDVLGCLVTNFQSAGSHEQKNERYITNLRQVQVICINKVAELMTKSGISVTASVFTDTLVNTRRGSLLTATGWRTYMNELYALNPAKRNWSHPYLKTRKVPTANPQDDV